MEAESRVATALRLIRRRWRKPFIALLAAGGLFGFLEIAEEVGEHETRQMDETVLLWMREKGDPSEPIGPPQLAEMARDITALGGTTILTGVSLVAWGMTLFSDRRGLAWIGMSSVALGAVAMRILKIGYDRPRPMLVEHETLVTSASFPSGHSMMAAVVYLSLGLLVARTQSRRRAQVFVVAVSIVVTVMVGVSRVFLGVHWPTDVLAGWMLGSVWALLVWIVAEVIERPKLDTATTRE